MSIYDYNIADITENITPPNHRLPKFLAWLTALLSPLQWLRDIIFNEYANGSAAPVWTSGATFNKGNRILFAPNGGVYEAQANGITGVGSDPLNNPTQWLKITDDFRGVRERIKYNGQKLMLEYILNHFFRPLYATTFRQPTTNAATHPRTVNGDNYYLPKSDIFIDNLIPLNQIFICANISTVASNVSNKSQVKFIMNSFNFSAEAFVINVPLSVANSIGNNLSDPIADRLYQRIIRSIVDKYVISGILYKIVTY